MQFILCELCFKMVLLLLSPSIGHNGINRLVDYCASKFAAVGFDESLRTELAVRI